MGRSRSVSRSRSRSPGARRSHRRPASPVIPREPASRCSLLCRNLGKEIRADDLRYAAEKYGRVRDVYIPRDYYSGEPRGIGFVEFSSHRDAEDARYALDRSMMNGREISVVFALQGRKRPDEYRGAVGPRYGGGGGGGSSRRRRSPSRSRSPVRRRSPSLSPRRSYSRSPKRSLSRSASRSPRRNSRSASPREPVRSPVRAASAE
ncbi:hypothetical protein WJX72_011201 [[Myrmecia] bisecta]|uniref:RRM domain-containing protein n=1 Tax=[Myrmecia] bisecta TaxID=41462 RepID=A0AAW1PUL4_9CHLO